MTDATVKLSARIAASESVEGFVLAGWHTRAGSYFRPHDDGTT